MARAHRKPTLVQRIVSGAHRSDTALEIARREAKRASVKCNEEWVEQELESMSVDGTTDASIGDCRVVTDCNVRDHEEVVSEHGGDRRKAYISAQAYLARGLSADGEHMSYNEDGTKVWVEIVGPDGLDDRDDDMDGIDHDDSDVIDYAGLVPVDLGAE